VKPAVEAGGTRRKEMNTRAIPHLALAILAAAGSIQAQEQTGMSSGMTGLPAPQVDDYTPETRAERLKSYVNSTFGPLAAGQSVARGSLNQARGIPHGWHGAGGFGSRVGLDFARHAIRQTIEHGAAAVLHEDNRYHTLRRGSVLARTRHAIVSTFVARRDSGGRRIAISRLGSAGGAAVLSHAWMPALVGSAASSFGLTLAGDMGVNVFREFWPDIRKIFRRK
jgi:hypothetical protein